MTAQGLTAAQAPPYAVSAEDAATIIRELGMQLIDAYNAAHAKEAGHEGAPSLWGSKQREQLLRALIARLARHARMFENAALSTSESALAVFARDAFKHGATRSKRDRKPIAKNVDKVINRWLRPLKLRLRLDGLERVLHRGPVDASMSGVVALAERTATFRLTLTFAYPWRATADRRLRITAKVEELESPGKWRALPFASNAGAERVALPEEPGLHPDDARIMAGQLEQAIALARRLGQHDLEAALREAHRSFLRRHPIAAAVASLFLVVSLGVAASPAGRRFVARVFDAIRSSGSLPELLEKLRTDSKEGVFVTPSGAQSQVAVSGSGSQVRISPGPSPDRMRVDAILSAADTQGLVDLIVPLSDLQLVGIGASQFREAKDAPIMPWFVELDVIPEQDAELAAELAREAASVSIRSDPPLPPAAARRMQHLSLPGKRVSFASELFELPRKEQRYAITATVRRASGATENYQAELRVDRSGFMTLVRDSSTPFTPVAQHVMIGHPICTSISNIQMGGFLFNQTDYLQATAQAFKEQEVLLTIYPPSAHPNARAATVDWGDGSRADFDENKRLFMAKHTYRVGERVYPIKVYFEGSPVTYQFDLYVFSTRGPERDVATLEYETPYPPNPEVTDIYQSGWDNEEIGITHRPGPVVTDSISFSRHYDPWVWRVPLGYKTAHRRKISYSWRDGTVLQFPEKSMIIRPRPF